MCSKCPSTTPEKVEAYFSIDNLGTGSRTREDRGLDWKTDKKNRKVTHVYVLRRDEDQRAADAMDFEHQKAADEVYVGTYHTFRDDFHQAMFSVTARHIASDGHYTLAESVFGVTQSDPLSRRVRLEECVEKLEDLGVPPYLHQAMEVDDKDDPSPSRTTRASNVPPSELAAMDDSDDAYPDRLNLLEAVRGWEVRTITSPLTFLETLIHDKRTFLIQTRARN